jgi:hypothetical protein
MTIVETYLRAVARLHETGFGTAELSAYTPLTTLLNTIGEELTPGVTAVTNLADIGAGHPAILLLQPALDANYQAVKGDAYPWPG